MIDTQTSGFARHHVEAICRTYGVDARASYVGTQIHDKLLIALREKASALKSAKVDGGSKLLLVDGKSVYVWAVRMAKDGDTYERNSEVNEVTRGSLKLLKSAYGEKNVTLTDVAGVRKVMGQKKVDRGTLKFYARSADKSVASTFNSLLTAEVKDATKDGKKDGKKKNKK